MPVAPRSLRRRRFPAGPWAARLGRRAAGVVLADHFGVLLEHAEAAVILLEVGRRPRGRRRSDIARGWREAGPDARRSGGWLPENAGYPYRHRGGRGGGLPTEPTAPAAHDIVPAVVLAVRRQPQREGLARLHLWARWVGGGGGAAHAWRGASMGRSKGAPRRPAGVQQPLAPLNWGSLCRSPSYSWGHAAARSQRAVRGRSRSPAFPAP